MKIVSVFFSVAACLALLSGCATASLQPYQAAQQVSASSAFTIGVAPPTTDHMHRFLDARQSELYMQNQGGGGVGVGLLLGPLGVLANVAAIKKQTEGDATLLHGKLPLDVQRLFMESLASAPTLKLVDGTHSVPSVAPLVYVEKIDDAHVRFASMLYVKSALDGKPWIRQYMYEVSDSYSRDELARGLTSVQLAHLAADLEVGFQWIAAIYASDVGGSFRPDQQGVIHSNFVTPRFQIAFRGYGFDAGPQRIGFVTGSQRSNYVFSLPADAATVTAK
jgi:hypothetical protein